MSQPSPTRVARHAATPEEAKALAHPDRLRIIRLTFDEALTNKELADRLGRNPGTTLYHLRMLVATGFVAAEEPPSRHRARPRFPTDRRGSRGRSTSASPIPMSPAPWSTPFARSSSSRRSRRAKPAGSRFA